ncbi:MAG: CynX/NimT family MFS transporter [Dehalococcoidia bacterium]
MSTARETMNEPNKWYLAALVAASAACIVAIPMMAMPPLFDEISRDLGLSKLEIGTIWGMVQLPGVLIAMLAGSLADRKGVGKLLPPFCVLAGVVGALRGLSVDFATLTLTVFLFGFMSATIPMNLQKTIAVYFSGKSLGTANGIMATGMAFGFILASMLSATVLSPVLGGWERVLFLYGALSVPIAGLWYLAEKKYGLTSSTRSTGQWSMRSTLVEIIKTKNVWMMALVLVFYTGCINSVLGYIPMYLRDSGWPGVAADGALATFHAVSMMMAIPLSSLSGRFGSRKVLLVPVLIATVVGVGVLSVTTSWVVWLLVIIVGVGRDAFMATSQSVTMELDEVGAAYTGTAMGFIMTWQRFGRAGGSPAGTSLSPIGLGAPFMLWAAFAAAAFVALLFVREGGRSRAPSVRRPV